MKSKLICIYVILWVGISALYASDQPKEKRLTDADQQALKIRITEQIKLFQDYCSRIAGKVDSDSLKGECITAVSGLFDSDEKTIEISSLYRNPEKREIQTYLSLLKELPYTQVKINSGAIQLKHPFEYSLLKSEQTGEEWYENRVDVIQKFEAFFADSLVYRDIVVREFNVFAKKVGETWTTRLRNIQVKQINTASRIKDAKAFYDTGLKHIEIYKEQKQLQELGLTTDEEQMYNALLLTYPDFLNAYLLNTKYTKLIREELQNSHVDYMFAGVYYYNQPDYLKAYEAFKSYIEIAALPIFTEDKDDAIEENLIRAQYFAGLTASQLEIPEITISLLEQIKDSEYMNSELYQYLASLGYEKTGDKINMERTLKEGYKKYPEDSFLLLYLIDMYHRTDRNEEAIQYLGQAIQEDQTNALLFFTMGRLYEYALKDVDNAEQYFLQALELNPDYTEAMSGLGRVYYNQAVVVLNEANEMFDPILYTQEVQKAQEIMKKSLPYFEKVHSNNPQDREALIALRSIYYNLNMVEEFDDIDKKCENLQ